MNFYKLGISVRLIISFGLMLLLVVGLTTFAAINMNGLDSDAASYMIAFGLVSVLAAIALAWWLNHSIAKPLEHATTFAKRMASGDLSDLNASNTRGELGELLQALQEISERVFKIVAHVRSGTTAVASTTGVIVSENAALSERTESQASALEETASSSERLTSTVKQKADHARQAGTLVAQATESAVKGGEVVEHVVN